MAAQAAFTLEPYDYAEARRLERELGLAEPVAAILVRRGYRTPEAARAFLESSDDHDPMLLGPMADVAHRVRGAIAAGRRITVHGDYDVDGVSATAILVGALRELGADADWYVPDRLGDGYGLTRGSVERIAGRGGDLLITVDCGIGSADAVAAAQQAGLEVIVTDHHEPPATLPDCLVLHPRVGDYPFGELCGAGVSLKLATALAGDDYRERSLDLVALATVADMVPLVGENRALVRRGLAVARRARRPGIRALCAEAGVDPGCLDEGDFAFRLGPRINAAGRLYRADSAIELMLTRDEERARAIAGELGQANAERRETERAVLDAAEAARAPASPEHAEGPALVLAGEGWHPGVVGIVASRMVERHGVPAILIGLDPDGRGRGSARSVPGFDMLAALDACAEHLVRYGGHRAAAGMEIEAGRVEAFREAFAEQARAGLGAEPRPATETIDAIVGGESLGLDVAEQLRRLAPFGVGNPEVRLLVPSARLADVRPMGEDDKHARFTLASGTRRALGVAFRVNGDLGAAARDEAPRDVSLRLEVNEWNGAVEPRVILGKLYEVAPLDDERPSGELGQAEWRARFEAELDREEEVGPTGEAASTGGAEREVVDRRGGSGIAAVASLESSGGPVLVLACDALRRRALVELAARPARFGGGEVVLVSRRLSQESARAAAERVLTSGRGVVLADWDALPAIPGLAARFEHVLAIDPPPSPEAETLAAAAPASGPGFLHLAWGPAEVALASRVLESDWPSRAVLGAVYRALTQAPTDQVIGGERLREALCGPTAFPRSPEAAARCLRVLLELGLVQVRETPGGRIVGVVSSEATELSSSAAYAAYRQRSEEGVRYLSRREQAS